jgi:hypothetical protein
MWHEVTSKGYRQSMWAGKAAPESLHLPRMSHEMAWKGCRRSRWGRELLHSLHLPTTSHEIAWSWTSGQKSDFWHCHIFFTEYSVSWEDSIHVPFNINSKGEVMKYCILRTGDKTLALYTLITEYIPLYIYDLHVLIVAWLLNVSAYLKWTGIKTAEIWLQNSAEQWLIVVKWELGQNDYDTSFTFGDKRPTVKTWVARFRTRHFDIDGEECSGRSTQASLPGNLDAFHCIILDDRRISTERIKWTLGNIQRKSGLYYSLDFGHEKALSQADSKMSHCWSEPLFDARFTSRLDRYR